MQKQPKQTPKTAIKQFEKLNIKSSKEQKKLDTVYHKAQALIWSQLTSEGMVKKNICPFEGHVC